MGDTPKSDTSFWRYYIKGFLPMVEAAHGRTTFVTVTVLMGAIGFAYASRWTWFLVPFWAAYSLLRGSWEQNQKLIKRVEDLEDKSPHISVSIVRGEPQPVQTSYALLVTNHGGRATFRARFRITDCSVSELRSGGHVGLWRGNAELADIYRGGEEFVLIGTLLRWFDAVHWSVSAWVGNRPTDILAARYVAEKTVMPSVDLEVVITADPPFADGQPWRGNYRFDANGLRTLRGLSDGANT